MIILDLYVYIIYAGSSDWTAPLYSHIILILIVVVVANSWPWDASQNVLPQCLVDEHEMVPIRVDSFDAIASMSSLLWPPQWRVVVVSVG